MTEADEPPESPEPAATPWVNKVRAQETVEWPPELDERTWDRTESGHEE